MGDKNSTYLCSKIISTLKKIMNITAVGLKLNYRKKISFFFIHLFARDILLMKKLEIEETKTTQYLTFKTDII